MRFFVGLHQPSDAKKLASAGYDDCLISINRLRNRKGDFNPTNWILDSGAFTDFKKPEIARFTEPYSDRLNFYDYVEHIKRWSRCGNLLAAVSMDMPVAYNNGNTHVNLSYAREVYRRLRDYVPDTYIMPVLQGEDADQYIFHIRMYEKWNLLDEGAWTAVGSLVGRPAKEVEQILKSIHQARPDLRLHGLGLKAEMLHLERIHKLLYSADSCAWSFAARYEGRNQNNWKEAVRYMERMQRTGMQASLF